MKRCYETARLRLLVLGPGHAESVLKFYENNADFLAPWESSRAPGFYTVSFQKRILSFEEEAFCKGQMCRFWIFLKNDQNLKKPIGTVSLSNIIRGPFQSCFLGYKLDEDHMGMGFMSESVDKVIDIAFNEMHLHRIEANVMPRNEKSLQLLKRLNFENEGLAKAYLNINGVWEDHYHMVKLNVNMV